MLDKSACLLVLKIWIGTPVPVFFKFIIPIILSINIVLEILPVQRLSDLTSLIIHGFTLHAHF